ncbi:DNA cytosine methyltransferase [Comamonas testosteroni]|uniref:DNA cytosine methyltransferase n=1 Tax=Comamonas testosteroni TaxID=285 RepID=UPI0015FD0C48|nr:DNA cytosine methyltransferase [Comamonas testosteroni]
MLTPQFVLALSAKLVIDLFAGGGGASTGIEQAIGRPVDIAINHDADAIGMHEANHPQTRHYRADIWEVCPRQATGGQPVGLLHASPDCTHHSQALGGQPRSKEIRSLAWVVPRWGGIAKPDVITLENVEQMLLWCRLIAKRCPETGRVITLDKIKDAKGKTTYRVADPGERVPRNNQYLVPDKKQLGKTWNRFVQMLRNQGYVVQWRVICNADLGCHSTRTRLYMIARRDGLPIIWPEKTHAKKPVGKLKPHKPAADCIDWSIPGTSIFGRKKPLAEATMRRIQHGMQKYVLGSKEPFIVEGAARAFTPVTHTRDISYNVQDPMRTITTAKGGETALMSAHIVQVGDGERQGQEPRAMDIQSAIGTVVAGSVKHAVASAYLVQAGHGEGSGTTKRRSHGTNDITGPVGTVTASGGGQSLATAFMVQANGGFNTTPARDLRGGMSTVTTSGSQQQLAVAHLTTLRRNSVGKSLAEPLPVVCAGGEHHGLVQYELSQDDEAGALRCAAFLMRYHGSGGQWADLREPTTTVTTRDRLALVTVWLKGEPWVIVDITLRMLVPRELYNAQDFPPNYIIDRTAAGKPLTKTAQVRMAGNSVSPLPMRLIVAANYIEAGQLRKVA